MEMTFNPVALAAGKRVIESALKAPGEAIQSHADACRSGSIRRIRGSL
jgi:hypothetical protein